MFWLFLGIKGKTTSKTAKNWRFFIVLCWTILGHFPRVLTDRVAILIWTPRYLQKTHHSAAVCSFSSNRRRAGCENLAKRMVFERFWKRAPLCSRLLVLLWFRALRRLRLQRRVLKPLPTLQPFAFVRHISRSYRAHSNYRYQYETSTSTFEHKRLILQGAAVRRRRRSR